MSPHDVVCRIGWGSKVLSCLRASKSLRMGYWYSEKTMCIYIFTSHIFSCMLWWIEIYFGVVMCRNQPRAKWNKKSRDREKEDEKGHKAISRVQASARRYLWRWSQVRKFSRRQARARLAWCAALDTRSNNSSILPRDLVLSTQHAPNSYKKNSKPNLGGEMLLWDPTIRE